MEILLNLSVVVIMCTFTVGVVTVGAFVCWQLFLVALEDTQSSPVMRNHQANLKRVQETLNRWTHRA